MKTKQQLLAMQEELQDMYGKLPREVDLLFEKKQLDILLNEPHVDAFMQAKKGVSVIFSEAFSNQVDGVALFERATTLSVDIKISYKERKIQVFIPKSKHYLKLMIQFISESEKLV